MAKGKKTRSKEDSLEQKHRTAKNKIRRYSALLLEKPDAKHASVWKNKVEKAEVALK